MQRTSEMHLCFLHRENGEDWGQKKLTVSLTLVKLWHLYLTLLFVLLLLTTYICCLEAGAKVSHSLTTVKGKGSKEKWRLVSLELKLWIGSECSDCMSHAAFPGRDSYCVLGTDHIFVITRMLSHKPCTGPARVLWVTECKWDGL